MKAKTYTFTNLVLMLLLAVLAFALFSIMVRNTDSLLHIFDGDGLSDVDIDPFTAFIILIFAASLGVLFICGLIFAWLIIGLLCFANGLVGLFILLPNSQNTCLRIFSIINLIVNILITSSAMLFTIVLLIAAKNARDFNIIFPIILLSLITVAGNASALISAFAVSRPNI